DQDVRRRAFVSGATGFILKPVDAIQLKALLNAYVHLDEVKRELKQKSVELEEQSVADAVTGLRSRRYFMDRGQQDVAFCMRREKDLAVIRIEVDRFADVQSSHSKERMNALLEWLGKLLLGNARTEDTVARLGDAEFAILAMDTNTDAAMAMCHRLRDTVAANPFSDGNVTVPINFHFGVAELGKDRVQTMEALVGLTQERLAVLPAEIETAPEVPVDNEVAAPEAAMSMGSAPTASVATSAPMPAPASADPMDNLSVEELEQLIRQEVSGPAKRKTFGKADVPPELVSIEAALKLLAQGRGDALDSYIEPLMERVKPLLDHYQAQGKKK
ncbi:MAG TPA: diguanylate cyclase, partial [Pyrinomonadaceae bacterium]|nr:diguanylate cyclase [Pyrinomonadaceae bacterium]